MLHKHKWVFTGHTLDYLTIDNKLFNYGEKYRCVKCHKELSFGSSTIYVSKYGYVDNINGQAVPNGKKIPLKFPEWGW